MPDKKDLSWDGKDRPYYRDRSGYSANPILRASCWVQSRCSRFLAFTSALYSSLIITTILAFIVNAHDGIPRLKSPPSPWRCCGSASSFTNTGIALPLAGSGRYCHDVFALAAGQVLASAEAPHKALPTFLMVPGRTAGVAALCIISAAASYAAAPTVAICAPARSAHWPHDCLAESLPHVSADRMEPS